MFEFRETFSTKMKIKNLTLGLALSGLLLAGCETPDGRPDRAGTGALLGAITGALIGGSHGRGGEGAVIGGAIGAVTGGLLGEALDQDHRERLRRQAPETYQRIDRGQELSVADVKSLVNAGISDDIILSQIANTQTSFRLSTADIIDLNNSGVSEKVITYMINTASTVVTAPAPPAPREERVVVVERPGPSFVWIGGEWVWRGNWVWLGGHWGYPPRPRADWVPGGWVRSGPNQMRRVPGHWH